MTAPRLEFQEGPLGTDGCATYKKSELTLVYASAKDRVPSIQLRRGRVVDCDFAIHAHSVFLIADTLTLRFDEYRVFVGLDAYTNEGLWKRVERLDSVEVRARGRLKIDWQFDSDRARLPGIPRFEFVEHLRRLHIYLKPEGTVGNYYEIGTGLIVGLKAGVIQEFIVQDLDIA